MQEYLFNNKGNFNTLVSEIPCDTTEYEIAPTPETGVMNWYQCVGKWHLEWLMEDIQDLLESNGKSNLQKQEDTKKEIVLIEELKQRLQREKVTPEKQNHAVDNFFSKIRSRITVGNKEILQCPLSVCFQLYWW